MKNKILVFFLSLLLIIGLLPLTAIADSAPTTLEAPTNLRAELKEDSDGCLTLNLHWTFQKAYKDLNEKY